MSFKNKLGRTVSYTVLLAGVLAAGNALAADPDGSKENPFTSLAESVDASSGSIYFKGDVNLPAENQNAVIVKTGDGKDNTLTIMDGSNITISGTHKVGDAVARNTIVSTDGAGTNGLDGGIIFEDGVNVKLSEGGAIEFADITINGGNFELSGKGEDLATAEGQEWRKGTMLSAEEDMAINNGSISLSDGAALSAKTITMKGGNVNLNGGDAFLRAFGADGSNGDISLGGDDEKTASITVTGEKNIIAANGEFNLNKNSELNLKNAVLDLVKNMPNASGYDAENNTGTVTNLAGIINVNTSTLNGNIEMNGTQAISDALTGLDDATEEEKNAAMIEAAPKANFTGNNIINGEVTNTAGIININNGSLVVNSKNAITNAANSIISVADGASLTAEKGITNKGYLDVAGRIESAVTNTDGQVSVKGSNAYIKQLTDGDLEISANTSSSELFGEKSSVDEAYISAGNEFTLDSDNFSAENYVTYGKLALSNHDVTGVTKTKIGNGGTLDLGSNTLGSATTTMWNGSTLSFNVDQTADGEERAQEGGKLDGDLAVILKDGESATINPTIALGVEDGTYTYANSFATTEGDDTGVAEPQLNISQNNMLYNVDFSVDNKNILEIEKKGADEVAQGVASAGGDANHAGLINAWVGGNANASALSGEARAMAEHLNTLAQTNPKAAVDAAKALAPEVNPVVDSHVTENARQIFNVAGSRLDSATRGMASGDSMFKKAGMWIQGLLNKTEYDKHDGFDVDSEGIAAGIDGYVTDNVKVGVGYAYTESDIDSIGRKTDADTNTGFIYGEYNAPSYYVNGVASYSKGDYKEKKNVAGKLARASYDVDAIAMQAIAGYKMGNFAPEAGLRYINAQQDAYTDTAGQHVGSNSSDTLTAILGGRYATNIQAGEYTLRPEVKLAATYDLMRDKNSTAVTLANGAGYLVRGENLDRFGIEAGVGLSMAVSDNVKVGLNYEGRFKEDYTDHTGILEARYNF